MGIYNFFFQIKEGISTDETVKQVTPINYPDDKLLIVRINKFILERLVRINKWIFEYPILSVISVLTIIFTYVISAQMTMRKIIKYTIANKFCEKIKLQYLKKPN